MISINLNKVKDGGIKKLNLKSAKLIIKNIKKLYKNVKINQKSNVISLVSNIFTRKYLNKFGFEVTNKIYNTSKRKAENEEFTLNDYKRYRPLSKLKTTNEIMNQIIEHIKLYSIVSKKENIFYLQQTKKYIYQEYIKKYIEGTIKLSTWYKYFPKNFIKPKKQSDKCPICDYGKKLGSKNILNESEKMDYEIYNQHHFFQEIQNKSYNETINNLKDNECVIIMDFKQNFIIGKGPIETCNDYYQNEQVSCLGFCVIYKHENSIMYQYINYFSKILSHDTLYVTECLNDLINSNLINRFKVFSFWSDNACHFRSGELMNHLFKSIMYKNIDISLNYFSEYHGKTILDGHFGLLQRTYNFVDKTKRINDINELIKTFKESVLGKKDNIFFLVYEREERPLMILRMRINSSKKYLSFKKVNEKMYGSITSSNDMVNYKEIEFKINEIKDNRKTKYSLYSANSNNSNVLSNRTRNLISSRFESFSIK